MRVNDFFQALRRLFCLPRFTDGAIPFKLLPPTRIDPMHLSRLASKRSAPEDGVLIVRHDWLVANKGGPFRNTAYHASGDLGTLRLFLSPGLNTLRLTGNLSLIGDPMDGE